MLLPRLCFHASYSPQRHVLVKQQHLCNVYLGFHPFIADMCWYVSAIDTIGRLLGQTSKANTVSYAHKRQIPSKDQFPWVWIFVAGVVPFGCIMYVATFSIMSRILWGRAYYPSPSNLTLLLQLLVLVCSHGSQLLTFPNSPFRGSPPVVEDRFFLRLIGILSVSILPQLSLG